MNYNFIALQALDAVVILFGEGVKNRTPGGRVWNPLLGPPNFTLHRHIGSQCWTRTNLIFG